MKNVLKLVTIFVMVMFLSACSRYTQENFDKIQQNMTMQQVTAILGEPTSSQSITIAGISGTSASWQDKNATITIQFLDNKMQIKTFIKSTSASSESNNQ